MTIKNYTFFSPSGTEFPVSATADRRLYLMLGGMDYNTFKMNHWVSPTNTGLNRIYTDTSLVVAGAYFELKSHTVTLNAKTTNFVHVNIDLSNITNPVFLTIENTDNSNNIDINTKTGIIKRCIEVVTTNGVSVVKVDEKGQDTTANNITVTGDLTQRYVATSFPIGYGVQVTAKRIGNLVTITFRGQNTGQIGAGVNPVELIPVGYRPIEFESIDFLVTGRHLDTYYHFNPDGRINYLGETIPVNSYFRGVRSYFTNDPWVN